MAADPVTARRLSPFLLPTSTTTSFLVLVSLTAGAAATGYTELFVDQVAATQSCMAAARAASPAKALAAASDFLDCTARVAQLRGVAVLAVVLGMVGVLLVVHRLTPAWQIRRHGLQPWEAGRYPLLDAIIDDAVAEAGVRQRPRFFVEPLMTAAWGRAFGGLGRPAVTITIGLARAYGEEQLTRARALIRHELAHIANRDLDIAGLSRVSLRVFAVVVVLPILAITAARDPKGLVPIGWRLLVVLAAISMIRAGLLRSREHEADVRASTWAEAAGDRLFLDAVFVDSRVDSAGRGAVGRLLRRIRNLVPRRVLDDHPRTARRAAVVADPSMLLRAGVGESFAAGIVTGLLMTYFLVPAGNVLESAPAGFSLLGLGLGFLLMCSSGTSLWRAALRALITGSQLPSGIPQGAALAIGLLAGDLVSPVYRGGAGVALSWVVSPVLTAVAIGITVAVAATFCRWVVGAAAMTLPVARGASLMPTVRTVQVIGSGVAAAVVTTATLTVGFIPSGSTFALFEAAIAPLVHAIGVTLVLAAPGLVVASALRRESGRERALWLGRTESATLTRPATRTGVVLGTVATVTVAAFVTRMTVVDSLFAQVTASSTGPDPATNFTSSEQAAYALLLLDAGVAAAAFVVATAVSRPRIGGLIAPSHGLVAAFFSGETALVLAFVEPAMQRCSATHSCPADVGTVLGAVFVANAMISVGVAIVLGPLVALPSAFLRRSRRRLDAAGQGRPARWLITQRTAFLVLAIGTLVPLAYFGIWMGSMVHTTRPSTVPPDITNAPPAPRPGSIPIAAACQNTFLAQANPLAIESATSAQLRQGQRFEGTSDRALRTFGSLIDRNTRSGDDAAASVGMDAANDYCRHLSQGS